MCARFAAQADDALGGQLTIVDARRDTALRDRASAAGFDLDKGVVVETHGQLLHGVEAVAFLARRSRAGSAFTIFTAPLRSPRLSRFLYPLLVGMRRLLLWFGKKELIRNLGDRRRSQ